MDAAAEHGRNPEVSTRFSLSIEIGRLTRDGTAETVSRDQILRRERGQGNINFPCSADPEQDWQPYPADPYSCYSLCDDYTYIPGITYHISYINRHAGTAPDKTKTKFFCFYFVWCPCMAINQ